MAAWLSHVPHPKLQWSLPSSRAQTLPNGHSIRVHPRVLRIASCKALIRLNVQRLVFVRPSVRARAASEEKNHQNVRSVRSRYSGRVRGRSQIFLVRSEYLLFSRVECSLYSYKIVLEYCPLARVRFEKECSIQRTCRETFGSVGGRPVPAGWSEATETAGCQAQQAPAELWLWTMRTTINLRLLERQHQPVAGRVWEHPHGSRAPG